jgi:N6-adenosine-specific RNA methylase IME4
MATAALSRRKQPRDLALIANAKRALALTSDLGEVREIMSKADSLKHYFKRVGEHYEAQQQAAEICVRAKRRAGELIAEMPKKKNQKSAGSTLEQAGIERKQSMRWQAIAAIPENKFEEFFAAERTAEHEITSAAAYRLSRHLNAGDKIEKIRGQAVSAPEGTYSTIVIDPPWPMEKIERECRPNQVKFDYPTMDEAALAVLKVPAAPNCHVWLWTTQRFLPMAFRLLDAWTLKYVATFVWHKPGGFQPVGLPQYNCEFALYARKGSPKFLTTKKFPTCFQAPRGKHSEKPTEFYDMVRRVTAAKRLDMFNRRAIEGFEGWGQEA